MKQSKGSVESNADIGPLKEVIAQPNLSNEAKDKALYAFAAERCDINKRPGVNKLRKAVTAAGKTSLRDIDDLAGFLRGLIHTNDPNRFANEEQLAGAKLAIQYAAESGYLAEAAREAVEKLSFVKTNADIGPLKEAIARPDLSNEDKDKALYAFAAERCDRQKRPGVNKLDKAVTAAGKTSLTDIDDLAGFLRGLIHTNDPNRFTNERQLAGAKLAIQYAAESGYLAKVAHEAVETLSFVKTNADIGPLKAVIAQSDLSNEDKDKALYAFAAKGCDNNKRPGVDKLRAAVTAAGKTSLTDIKDFAGFLRGLIHTNDPNRFANEGQLAGAKLVIQCAAESGYLAKAAHETVETLSFAKTNADIGPLKAIIAQPDLSNKAKDKTLYAFAAERCDNHKRPGVNKLRAAVTAAGKTSLKDIEDLAGFLRGLIHTKDPNRFANERQLAGAKLAIQCAAESGYLAKAAREAVERLSFVKTNADIGPLKAIIDRPDLSNEDKDEALYAFAAERCANNKRQGVNKLDQAVTAAGKTSLRDIDDLTGFLRGLIHTNDPNRFANEEQLAGAKLAIQYAAESGYLAEAAREAVEKLSFVKTNADIGSLKEVIAQPNLSNEAKDKALYAFAAERCNNSKRPGVNKLRAAVKAAEKTSLADIEDLAGLLRGLIHTNDPNRFADERQLAGAKLAIQYAAESGYLAKAAREAVEKLSFVKTNADIGPLKEVIARPDLSNKAKDKALYEFAAERCGRHKKQGVNKLRKAVTAAGKTSLTDIEDLAGFLQGLIHTNDPNRFANELQLAGAKLAIQYAAESGYLAKAAREAVEKLSFVKTNADIGPLKEVIVRPDLSNKAKDKALYEFAAERCDRHKKQGVNKLRKAVTAAGKTSLKDIEDLAEFLRGLIHTNDPNRFVNEKQLAGATLAIRYAAESGYLAEAAHEAVKSVKYPRAPEQSNPGEKRDRPLDSSADGSASDHSDSPDIGGPAEEVGPSSLSAQAENAAAESAARKGKKRIERSPSPDPRAGDRAFAALCRRFDLNPDETVCRWITQEAGAAASTRKLTLFDANDAPLFHEGKLLQFSDSELRVAFELDPAHFQASKRLRREPSSAGSADESAGASSQWTAPASPRPAEAAREAPSSAPPIDLNRPPAFDLNMSPPIDLNMPAAFDDDCAVSIPSPERDELAVFSSPVVKAESAEADFAGTAAGPSPPAYLAVAADQATTALYPAEDIPQGQGDEQDPIRFVPQIDLENPLIAPRSQTPSEELDCVFPLRDPENPMRVHRDYADPQDPTRMAAHFEIVDVSFSSAMETLLRRLLSLDAGLANDAAKKTTLIEKIRGALRAELTATMAGSRPAWAPCMTVKPLGEADLTGWNPVERQALEGQHGLIVTNPEGVSLFNGRVGGVYAGSYLRDEADQQRHRQYQEDHGHTEDESDAYMLEGRYGAGGRRHVILSPLGGGNRLCFANTRIENDPKKNEPDQYRYVETGPEPVNAQFMPFRATFRDARTDETREEHLYMVAVHGRPQPGRQILINYGPAYLRQFAQARAPAAASIDVSALNLLRPLSPPEPGTAVKAEPPSSPPAESAAEQAPLPPLPDAVSEFIVKAGGDPAGRRPAREGERIPAGSVVSPPLGNDSPLEEQSVVVVTPKKAVLEVTYAQLKGVSREGFLKSTGKAWLVVDPGFSLPLKRRPPSPPTPPTPASRRRR
jgi:hypothetical protein